MKLEIYSTYLNNNLGYDLYCPESGNSYFIEFFLLALDNPKIAVDHPKSENVSTGWEIIGWNAGGHEIIDEYKTPDDAVIAEVIELFMEQHEHQIIEDELNRVENRR